ncbi:UNKNOWN [Stylonychia lemnae]|uniref:Uncharacterized protein n=1 Tax=Stylonychia lemnae TaxID=5949 RepID=A0A078AEH4_STYLE|nr:UNKNOWN [Stylonychia lemnae]|eukprot:CDW80615.1 UNKNOWN [Stylonychia lemnae]
MKSINQDQYKTVINNPKQIMKQVMRSSKDSRHNLKETSKFQERTGFSGATYNSTTVSIYHKNARSLMNQSIDRANQIKKQIIKHRMASSQAINGRNRINDMSFQSRTQQTIDFRRNKMQNDIQSMLNRTFQDMKLIKDSGVISGSKNLEQHSKLNNHGHVKRIINQFMKQDIEHIKNELKHDKRDFIPFDFLDHQRHNRPYVKKTIVFRPRKEKDKIEFADEIPRRWKEQPNSPLKNTKYFDQLEHHEMEKLQKSFVPNEQSRNIEEENNVQEIKLNKTSDLIKKYSVHNISQSPINKARKLKAALNQEKDSLLQRSSSSSRKRQMQKQKKKQFKISLFKNNIFTSLTNNYKNTSFSQNSPQEYRLNQSILNSTNFSDFLGNNPKVVEDLNSQNPEMMPSRFKHSFINGDQQLFKELEQHKRRSYFKVKVFDKDSLIQQNKNKVEGITDLPEDETIIESMVVNNLNKRCGTANFKSSIERQFINEKKEKAPPVGSYDYSTSQLYAKMKNENLDLLKIPGRKEQKDVDGDLNYKGLLNNFNYSTFKEANGPTFNKIQPRDDVSFLKHLARYQMARQLGMDMQEFEQLWKIDKQGVYERLLMLRKS